MMSRPLTPTPPRPSPKQRQFWRGRTLTSALNMTPPLTPTPPLTNLTPALTPPLTNLTPAPSLKGREESG